MIKTSSFSDTTFQINLPSSISDNLHWCNPATGDTPEHKAFQLNSENTPQFVNGNTKFTREAVRKYLAGAYFLIDDDLILANDFPGLGAGTTGDYAFRSVIVGKNNGTESTPDYPTRNNDTHTKKRLLEDDTIFQGAAPSLYKTL